TNDTAATLQPPPPPPAVTNAGSGTTTANPGGTVTTPPAAPDPDMVINVTANGTYSSGSGDDTYNVSIGTFGNIAAAAGYDRVLVDTIGSINLSGGSLVGVEEFSTANPQGNNVVMTYDLTMTTGSDNNQLLVELDAADTLFLNMQNLGFRLTDVRADSLTLSNGTQTVLIETPDINNVNLSGIDALQIGAVMSDGSIFAGYTDNFEMLFVTSVASAPLTWNDGSGTGYVLTGSSFTDGQSNTNNLVATDSNTVLGGMQAHNAAQYAFDLTAHGYSDWYLPSNDELITLYQNKVSGSFNGIYWSSTDSAMSSEAFAFNFGTGQEVDTLKSNSLQVLAVRRMERVEIDGHFLGDATPQTRNVTRESSHVELRGGTDDLIITTSAVRDSYFNGGDGYDRMLLQDDGILDLAALGQGNVRQFEEIRFDLPGTQTIRITLDQIFQLMKESDASNTLSISSPGGDPKTLEIVGGGTPTLGGAFDEMGAAADEYSFVINSVVHTLYIDDSITVAVV
ncbi:MAG: DUF1566 domain-containing protein, partial [Alphaproteobacteria bacterium]|nr:DUF1566 domain-containing protein [Alphaproteobacteria bacterium]